MTLATIAQSEVIATLTQLNEQLQAKLKQVGKETPGLPVAQSSAPQPTAQPQTQSSDDTLEKVKAAAAKEVRVLKEQMAQLKKEVQAKDEQCEHRVHFIVPYRHLTLAFPLQTPP
jgi:tellurite resistance protein